MQHTGVEDGGKPFEFLREDEIGQLLMPRNLDNSRVADLVRPIMSSLSRILRNFRLL